MPARIAFYDQASFSSLTFPLLHKWQTEEATSQISIKARLLDHDGFIGIVWHL
jgi:hypothetical protein